MCQFDADIEELEEEIKSLEAVAQNPDFDIKKQESDDETKQPVKRVILDREWDKPKLSNFLTFVNYKNDRMVYFNCIKRGKNVGKTR
jgi:hypothetical protein